MLTDDASLYEWSARKWADALRCREGTVKGTTTWKTVMAARAIRKADRATRGEKRFDRRHNGRS